ncbi:hypothetical protein C8R46DRAFT_1068931 [Mycena filopes]|nr:hypothetical protein C8R46DRAFT_1068870 [Mycena filopes]KAJ7182003.1 hypothetical protein C8R46DRAFT_1068931 [Mycena filopes]
MTGAGTCVLGASISLTIYLALAISCLRTYLFLLTDQSSRFSLTVIGLGSEFKTVADSAASSASVRWLLLLSDPC